MTSTASDETLTWELRQVDPERMKVMALLLADPNPIHFDPEAAAGVGAPRVVNQGPSTMATVYNLFEQARPDHRVARVSFRLLGNVLAGDSVSVSAVPDDTVAPAAQVFDVSVVTGEGVAVITARAELVRREETSA